MLNRAFAASHRQILHNFVQKRCESVHDVPANAVLLEVLKSIECELQRKGHLPPPTSHSFNPLWFLAETERNVFLWRSGLSLSQKDELEVWIEVKELIEKRLAVLDAGKGDDNPFVNPLWESSLTDPGVTDGERRYLNTLKELLEPIHRHAHALSVVGSLLQERVGKRERVMLPLKKKA